MLGKLLKYEFNATCRTFLPMYIALILVASFNRIFRAGDVETGFAISMMLIVGLFMALGVITFVVIIQRFNKNLLGDEGYLMFTLPVKVPELIFSKLIISFFWNVVSGFVACLTFMILVGDKLFLNDLFTNFSRIWEQFCRASMKNIGMQPGMFIVIMIIMAILAYTGFIFHIYLSLATAQLPIFNKHRGIIAFVAFFVINLVFTIVWTFINHFLPVETFKTFSQVSAYLCISMLITNVILYYGTHYILQKHLNLE